MHRMSYGRVVNYATALLAGRNKCYKDGEWCKLGQDKLQVKERKKQDFTREMRVRNYKRAKVKMNQLMEMGKESRGTQSRPLIL